jgi:hypothetical protein
VDRRRWALVAVAVAVALTVVWVAAAPYVSELRRKHELRSLPLARIGASRAEAGCRPEIRRPATGAGDHVRTGTPVRYPDAPPAFGPHWADYLDGDQLRNLYTTADRPPVERLVHSLEHGHTILWYDDTVRPGTTAWSDLRELADRFSARVYFIAAPWEPGDGAPFPTGTHVVLTHWTGGDHQQGVWEYCARPSGQVVGDFLLQWSPRNAPEPGAP